jgi:predicted transposase YbfD/YdcC
MENLITILEKVPDPRQAWKIKHKLSDILLICLFAVTCNANSALEIHDFAIARQQWLQTFLSLEHGIPSRLTFARVLQLLSPKAFAICFTQIMSGVEAISRGRVVALDGKALAGTYHNEGRKGLIYMISAWCSENKLSLAQVKTHDKSNEITAIPELLDLLDLKGAVVTMDAMGCQKSIVKKIVTEKKADYLIGLKGNQGTMHREFLEYAQAILNDPQKKTLCETYRTIEKGHGRIEKRNYYLFRDLDWFPEKKEWTGLSGLLLTESQRSDIKSDKQGEKEIRLYITSMKGNVQEIAQASRTHWGIENNLHWVLDVEFREDQWQTRMDMEAANLSQLRRLSANLLKLETDSKVSIQRKRYLCSLDVNYMEKVVFNPKLFS